jgi:anti-sigma factor RsiW
MSCKKYKILLSEYIEGTLSDSDKLNLESHLKKCARCKKELELLQNYKKFHHSKKGKLRSQSGIMCGNRYRRIALKKRKKEMQGSYL